MKRAEIIDTDQGVKRKKDKERGGSQRKDISRKRAGRKKGRGFVPYDYEKAYNQALADLDEWFVGQMLRRGTKSVYALKEIRAGEQFEVEIYPQFRSMGEVPPGRKGDQERQHQGAAEPER